MTYKPNYTTMPTLWQNTARWQCECQMGKASQIKANVCPDTRTCTHTHTHT
eukprot:m.355463 g.355463  ORF g.355463 m.355463 type:complete len:51 (-) comp17257_c0_seq1:1181-1333(-)